MNKMVLIMNAQMSSRERLLAALRSKETDRLPWSPLIDPYFSQSLPLQGYNMEQVEAMRFIGNDIMERHIGWPQEKYEGISIREEKTADATRTYYDTAVGSLYLERRSSGNTSYISKHMVESIEDIRVFTYICKHTGYQPRIEEFAARDAYIGDSGIATLTGNMSPIQELLQHSCGVENTVYLLADYEDEMLELFNAMHERNKRQYEVLLQYPCEVIFDYEDTSTTVMNRMMFTEYSMPFFNDYADMVHESGKVFITHMCGKLNGFKEDIAKGRQDGIDSVCPPSTGDLCSWEARAAFGSKLLIGGIEPPSLVRMSTRETLNTVVEIINKVIDKRGFILSTGDAVPYGTPINNLKCITDLIARLGPASLGCGVDLHIVEEVLKAYE